MMSDYRIQFETLTKSVEENNKEIDFIRQQLAETQKQYFSLRGQNEILQEETE